MKLEFWHQFQEYLGKRKIFVMITLLECKGSVPQEVGAKMLVDSSGLLCGTIGGGAIEAHSIKEAQKLLAQKEPTKLVSLQLANIGMTCGGSVQLFFECFNLSSWHVAIFGAGHVAQALVPVLLRLPAIITCIDTREEWLSRLVTDSRLNKCCVQSMPETVATLPPDTFVVIMTRGHEFDLAVLEASLKRGFPYVGLMGSKTKAQSFRHSLKEKGFDEKTINSFYCPVGLAIGTSEPEEIAISITAQLLEKRGS